MRDGIAELGDFGIYRRQCELFDGFGEGGRVYGKAFRGHFGCVMCLVKGLWKCVFGTREVLKGKRDQGFRRRCAREMFFASVCFPAGPAPSSRVVVASDRVPPNV